MDSAYDGYENYRFAIEGIETTLIIVLNPRGRIEAITRGSLYLGEGGSYTCIAGFKAVYWGKGEKRERLKCCCPTVLGKCQCLFRSICSPSFYGRTFCLYPDPDRDYRLIRPIPRGIDLWQQKYNACTGVERAYSGEKGSHRLADPRVTSLAKVRIHTYLALSTQVIKRIRAMTMEKRSEPELRPTTA